MSDFEEEEDHGIPITKKAIKESIKKHSGYSTPELNDTLYLHYQSFTRIENLDPYVNLKALWLNNNAISVMTNLSALKNLTCLYLQSNIIEKIEGLEELTNLKTLVLSHNFISKIEGLSNCKELTTLEIDHNKLREPESIEGIVECPSISILNMSDNNIDKEEFAQYLPKLPNLRVLRNGGNPVTRNMDNYRRRLICQNKELRYLDDSPVEEDERRTAEAWGRGGKEAEKAERAKIKEEKKQRQLENIRAFNRMQKEAILAAGQKLEDHPEFIDLDAYENQKPAEKQEEHEEEQEESFFVTDAIDEKKLQEQINQTKRITITVDNSKDENEEEEEQANFVQRTYPVEHNDEPQLAEDTKEVVFDTLNEDNFDDVD